MLSPLETQITQLYIGYFGRCPDRDGFNYWMSALANEMSLVAIAESFFVQPEAVAIYGGLDFSALIDRIYLNLFRRTPDPAGKAYWLGLLQNGHPVGRMIVDIISGAQGADALMIGNAATVAHDWMLQQSSLLPFDLVEARAVIASINNWQTPNGANVTIASPELLPHAGILVAAIREGWAQWGVTGSIDIEVLYQPSGHINNTGETRVLLSAKPRMEVDTGTGFTASGVEHELETGLDPNGKMGDLTITVMTDIEWLLANYSGAVLAGLMAHECGHAFLREGWSTSYMQLISFAGGSPHFIGSQAMVVHGGPVPLFATDNYVHVAVPSSVMWPYASQYVAYRVTPLDKAMLRDMGIWVR